MAEKKNLESRQSRELVVEKMTHVEFGDWGSSR